MKTFNAIYKYGHLYDRKTGKRILLREDAELALVIPSEHDDLFTVDPMNQPNADRNRPRTQQALQEQIADERYHEVRKIMDRGQHLYFTIKAGQQDENRRHRFVCCFRVELLEELYLVFKSSTDTLGEFFIKNNHSCSCVVDKVVYGELDEFYFEPIYGSWLNDAYTLTYEMYFSRYGRCGVNIYKQLTFRPHQAGEPFMELRKKSYWV